MLIPDLQQQFIHIQLRRSRLDAAFHYVFGEVVGSVECDVNAVVDLMGYGFEAVEVELAWCWARGSVVAVHVAD